MRVCINTWALYNSGLHLGTWCDIEDYEDTLEELREIQEENNIGSDIEPFLAGWAGDYLGLCYEESSLEYLKEAYERYEGLDDWGRRKLEWLIDVLSYDFESAFDNLENVDCYEAKGWEDLAIQFIEEGLYGEYVRRVWETNSCYLNTGYIGSELRDEFDVYDGYFFRLG